jgi:tRNA(Ile2) C34 agmatinyltransferase TiaS
MDLPQTIFPDKNQAGMITRLEGADKIYDLDLVKNYLFHLDSHVPCCPRCGAGGLVSKGYARFFCKQCCYAPRYSRFFFLVKWHYKDQRII